MAAASPPKPKPKPKPSKTPVKPPKKKSAGRPKKNLFVRSAKNYKIAATGETRNSPMTDPNIIFWLGIGLIIFSGWSSGRIKNIFAGAWNGAHGQDSYTWWTDIKIFASQFLFLFVLVITARAIPPLARIWLVIVGGLWILYLMKNPQVLQLLNWTSVGANNQQQYTSLVFKIRSATNSGAA